LAVGWSQELESAIEAAGGNYSNHLSSEWAGTIGDDATQMLATVRTPALGVTDCGVCARPA
jgi:hypothetical protein